MSTFTSTILITGATTGLGYWTACELGIRYPDAKIVIASRTDKDHAAASLTKLISDHGKSQKTSIPDSKVEWLRLDLASKAAVRKFVKTLDTKSLPPISHLLLNAGLQFHKGTETRNSPDGVESTFAINHVGHALLFFFLKSKLTNDARIIITASGTHDPAQKTMVPDAIYESADLLAHPTDKEGYEKKMKGAQRYSSSKLANVIFTKALERRLKAARDSNSNSKDWTVNAFDPGLMPGTELAREAPWVLVAIVQFLATRMIWLVKLLIGNKNVHLPQESARSLAVLASVEGQEARDVSGRYYEGRRSIESSEASKSERNQEDLWKWTLDFVAEDEEERREFETF